MCQLDKQMTNPLEQQWLRVQNLLCITEQLEAQETNTTQPRGGTLMQMWTNSDYTEQGNMLSMLTLRGDTT